MSLVDIMQSHFDKCVLGWLEVHSVLSHIFFSPVHRFGIACFVHSFKQIEKETSDNERIQLNGQLH